MSRVSDRAGIATVAARQFIRRDGGGKIISTAPVARRRGFDEAAPCRAPKRGAIALTQSGAQSGARDLAEHAVAGVAPGVVGTEMRARVDRGLPGIGAAERPGRATDALASGILKGRAATPADVTGATTFPPRARAARGPDRSRRSAQA